MKNKLRLKKGDAVITAVLMLLAVVMIFASPKGNATAEIICENEVLTRIELNSVSSPYSIDTGNGVVIGIEKNAVFFLKSDCSGQDCVNCGRLTSPGDTAVCIPNKTIIRLTGKTKHSADAIVY